MNRPALVYYKNFTVVQIPVEMLELGYRAWYAMQVENPLWKNRKKKDD